MKKVTISKITLGLAILFWLSNSGSLSAQIEAGANKGGSITIAHTDTTNVKSLDSLRQVQVLRHKIDSLKSIGQPYNKYVHKLDSLTQLPVSFVDNLEQKTDSALQNLEEKITTVPNKVIQKTDSALQKIEGKVTAIPNKAVQKVDGAVQNLEGKITTIPDKAIKKADGTVQNLEGKITSFPDKAIKKTDGISDKLLSAEDQVGGKANEKIQKLGKTTNLDQSIDQKIGSLDGKIPTVPLQGKTLGTLNDNKLPKTNTSGLLPKDGKITEGIGQTKVIGDTKEKLSSLKNEIGEVDEIKKGTDKLNAVKSFPKEKIDRIKSTGEHEKVTESTSKLKEVSSHVDGYKNDIKQLSGNNPVGEVQEAPETLKNKAQKLDEIKALESQKGEMMTEMGEIEQYKDQAYAKEQMKSKAKEAAVNHFAKHQDKLRAAQEKLAKLKKKYSSVESMKALPEKKPNPMKEKTLGERLVLGGNFQVHKGDPLSIDFSPKLGYRLTKMLTLGLSGVYRATIDDDEKYFFTKENETFGYRVFAEHEVYKSFFVYSEYERINTSPKLSRMEEGTTTSWSQGGYFGIGKKYKLIKSVKGNVVFLYNFLHDETSPYDRPWSIRFGFEVNPKVKKKSKTEPKL